MNTEDTVIKRNGKTENLSFDKILKRIKVLSKEGEQLTAINYSQLTKKIIDRLYDKISTTQIDELTAQQCASLFTTHSDYNKLASRILISNHHKNTSDNFYRVMNALYQFKDIHGKHHPIVCKKLWETAKKHKNEFNKMIDYKRDYLLDYFGFKTLERAYLMRCNGEIIERPQHLWMRVAIGIHGEDLEKVKETYDLMSQKYFTHATPTLFNAGTPRPQLSSCYLIAMENDSIDGIYNTLKDCAKISKWAGGIGLHIHNIRASGTHIRGTNGTSNGLVPMLRVFNNTARYVDQGGGKRHGSFAMYLEPWHADIEDFLDMKKNHGDEEARARDLFYALWIPDLFMQRVKDNLNWTLMCPDKCPGLSDVYGDEFESLYTQYESENRGNKTMKARDIWFKILDSQIETGTPYMLYKDACNRKSNQKNLGTIKSSNLCTEIIEYSDDKETAVCNLASIALSRFIKKPKNPFTHLTIYSKTNCNYCKMAKFLLKKYSIPYTEHVLDDDENRKKILTQLEEKHKIEIKTVPQLFDNDFYIGDYTKLDEMLKPTFDYNKLHEVTKIVTYNLNKVIDINFYPTEKTSRSNYLHRPIGLGVQGLADAFAKLRIPFTCEKAKEVNKNIFETIYHAAIECSMEIARDRKEKLKHIIKLYEDKIWTFKNSKLDCREYIFKKGTDVEDISQVKLLAPVFAEFKKLKVEHVGAYSSFEGSPTSEGKLQFDLWNLEPSTRYDWQSLKTDIQVHGIRNSLLLAPMPTASTSQILGNNECFEPFTSNIYVRRTIAGEFIMVNKYLMEELIGIGLWNEELKNQIILNNGSIQNIKGIPSTLKEKYKIVWEMSMKDILNMVRDRGMYICQSQSTNLWMKDPNYKKLTAMHMHAWKLGLKTGIYYLRTKAKAAPQQFTINPDMKNDSSNNNVQVDDEEDCLMCGA
jgi:ribonucleoside-diphosphate reductase alpha subunit